MTPAIEIHDLVHAYPSPEGRPVRVLDIPALTLGAGQELAIGGPSGSGKTTLFQIIAGLLLPTSGELRVLGEPILRLREAERDRFRAAQIGYVFQTSNLLAGFSALENVLLAMGFAGVVPPGQRRRRAQELLERVGLGARLHYRPAQLSSGQQQRVAVARAVANRPGLVLADEPTAHVDPPTGALVLGLLREVCADHGAALLLASHDQAVLAEAAATISLRPDAQLLPTFEV